MSKTKKNKLVRENKSILSFFKRVNEVEDSCSQHKTQESSLRSNTAKKSLAGVTFSSTRSYQRGSQFPNIRNKGCPRYKWLAGTPFTVDAFKYGTVEGCIGYFLTHFHYDHYCGLTSKFKGTIYCSEITAKLVRMKFGPSLSIIALSTNAFTNICGFEILLIDANHCPGSVLIISPLPDGTVNLHTGDFRAQASMLESPNPLADFIASNESQRRINTIYLDTTFCSPRFTFPDQEAVIAAAVEISREALINHPDALILCGMYTIGKERFVSGLAEKLNARVWLPPKQRGLISAAAEGGCHICQRLTALSTTTAADASIHVVDMLQLNPRAVLTELLPLNRPIIAWKPSGWMYNPQKKLTQGKLNRLPCSIELLLSLRECVSVEMIAGRVYIFGAAYSEHSSFEELKEFVTKLRPLRVQQTVFGGETREAGRYINEWLRSN
ncbi:hypothetical protein Aperf_G00000070632 [Anoplocephala perfoliata]